MLDPTEVAVELDVAHEKAKVAFSGKDLGAYMSLFSPDLRYRQSDGKVIDRDRLKRDIQTQFSRLSAASSAFVREQIELTAGKAIEILSRGSDLVPSLVTRKSLELGLTLRQGARERRISNVKPFIGTLRVTNPARQSWTSSRKRVLRGGG